MCRPTLPLILLFSILIQASAIGQPVKPGMEAPPIAATPLDPGQPFPGWPALHGHFVVIDFWATWCGPCLPGLARLAALQKEFSGQPIRFLTVANDEMDPVKSYFAEKGLALQTYVDGDDHPTYTAYGIVGIPATVIVNPHGRILAITPGENVTASVLGKLLKGEPADLPPFEAANDITWDRDQITWQDGVQPTFEVLIKPTQVADGGYMYAPGSNHISGDGTPVRVMIQAAWQTDRFHVECRCPLTAGTYRFAALVPKGDEADLFPTLQNALGTNFGFQAHWEEQERDVLVLTVSDAVKLSTSTAEPQFQFMRGRITLKNQPISKLASALPNWLDKIVVNETALNGSYDLDLPYRPDDATILTNALREKYGLILTPAKRRVRILVVEKRGS
jgi:uncharacterized protein (TIGR03435 family)